MRISHAVPRIRSAPAIATIQKTVAALQDHFPNRLGVVALLNLSRGAEIVVNLIKPWLTKDDLRRFRWMKEAEREFQPFHQRNWFAATACF